MTRKYVMQNHFHFLKESDSSRIRASLDTDLMVLKYVYPKRDLKEKSLLLMKNRRTRGFTGLGLRLNMPSVV